ncbi:GGDEF domain-containing protein [Altericroceibacterium endophyticum]|uniref:diguanylate cyclase n=1 Tax=Altericroceibacterium endophyticum TaxID=1808508 RepID=A0A6I4T3N1_9SPHN|nr:GGDEF domain-containing protein [Altericroceibacterium endophyticum]MXO64889.1 diguanylate cyclase [Altericroceibacterium endophyticum]
MDFTTLYIVAFFDSIALCVIWGILALNYREIMAAWHWFLSSALWLLGGLLLASQRQTGLFVGGVSGNALMLAGFLQIYIGVRVFYRCDPGYRFVVPFFLFSVAAMLASFDSWAGRNPVYLATLAVPLFATARFLLQRNQFSPGRLIAAGGLIFGIFAMMGWFVMNVLYITNVYTGLDWYRLIASTSLAGQLFAALVWNFGLIVMAVDRLRGEVAKLANEDALTGLVNRRYVVDRLKSGDLAPSPAGASVLMIDVDHFKRINDAYGHAAGDACLGHIGNILKNCAGPNDVVARIAGDEFALFLPESSRAKAEALARVLIDCLSHNALIWRGERLFLSVSIGLSEWVPNRNGDVMEVLESADEALFKVKRDGRGTYLTGDLPGSASPNVKLINPVREIHQQAV